jgi:hypothetical protein
MLVNVNPRMRQPLGTLGFVFRRSWWRRYTGLAAPQRGRIRRAGRGWCGVLGALGFLMLA